MAKSLAEKKGLDVTNGDRQNRTIGVEVEVRADRIFDDDGGRMFKGMMEQRVVTPYKQVQIKKLVDSISRVQGIKKAGEYGSEEEGAKVVFEITEAMPLFTVLGKIPMVISAVDEGDVIKLMLKP